MNKLKDSEYASNFTSNAVCPICGISDAKFLIQKYDDRFGCPGLFDFFCCHDCNVAFLKNKICKEKLPGLYEQYYASETVAGAKSILLRKILKIFKLDNLILNKLAGNIVLINEVGEEGKILEIGSGFDKKTKEIIEEKSLNWTGLEVNKECVDRIKRCKLSAYHGTIDDISMIEEKFDKIILSQALEHQYDVSVFFENCKKLLNPNGKIIFTTPNFESRYRKKYRESWIGWHAPYHMILLSRAGIDTLCKKYGFEVIKYFTYTPTSWYMLQRSFKIPQRGEINKGFSMNFSLISQFLISIFLRIIEKIKRNSGDCIYCEIKMLNNL